MFLTCCELLASEQPTIAAVIIRLDAALESMGKDGEIEVSDLAFQLGEEKTLIESVLEELVAKGGFVREERIVCKNGCLITPEEYEEAVADSSPVRCPQCSALLRRPAEASKTVYRIMESAAVSLTGAVPDGLRLEADRTYKMLFAAANPDVEKLAIDREWKRIEQRIRQKQCRVGLERVDRWAVTLDDLREALVDNRPCIVHFSGHGTNKRGLNFANDSGEVERITGQRLGHLFGLCKFIECVVLNACHSADQADAIATHVHCVVAMIGQIRDDDAIAFATGFYTALTAGEPYGRCFGFGMNAVDPNELTSDDRPAIWLDGIKYLPSTA